jgi:nitroimidazol reductase NimA-like FMN-containing flavoprotein (pyridoxamine 5'-phosphate oxidase superfamily)
MAPPQISRPEFPDGYVERPNAFVRWEDIEQRLAAARNYWLCSVRPDGRPHVMPRWGAFVDGRFYYDGSPETRHARNLAANPNIAIHLESGDQVVVLEGVAAPVGKPARELAEKIARSYREKYRDQGYAPKADQWDAGGLYEFTPRKCLAWTQFTQDPTRFVF